MSLHIDRSGEGRDLVLLHGWGVRAAIWQELARELAQDFRVHAVDLPGYGKSAACDPYTSERIAAELAASLPPRCRVCGWSWGGQIALLWARRAPQQVVRLALIATTPCFAQRDDWPHAVAAEELRAFGRALAEDREATLSRFVALQSHGDERAERVRRQLQDATREDEPPGAAVLQQGLESLLGVDLRRLLPEISQPVLVMQGDRDALTPPAAGVYLSRMLADARLAMVDGAAHAPFVSDAKRARGLLESFFDE